MTPRKQRSNQKSIEVLRLLDKKECTDKSVPRDYIADRKKLPNRPTRYTLWEKSREEENK